MNYVLDKYKNRQWAIFCNSSLCWVMFGPKKVLEKRLIELNRGL